MVLTNLYHVWRMHRYSANVQVAGVLFKGCLLRNKAFRRKLQYSLDPDIFEERDVMTHYYECSAVCAQGRDYRFQARQIQIVGWFIQYKQLWSLVRGKQAGQSSPHSFTPAEHYSRFQGCVMVEQESAQQNTQLVIGAQARDSLYVLQNTERVVQYI